MHKRPQINIPKLLLELSVIAGIIFAVAAAKVLPDIIDQPVYGKYNNYKTYYRMARDYDYTNGPDSKLEEKLVKAAENGQIDFMHQYYNKMGLAEYYIGTERYEEALTILENAKEMVSEEPQLKQVWNRIMICHEKLGQTEQYKSAAQRYATYQKYEDDV